MMIRVSYFRHHISWSTNSKKKNFPFLTQTTHLLLLFMLHITDGNMELHKKRFVTLEEVISGFFISSPVRSGNPTLVCKHWLHWKSMRMQNVSEDIFRKPTMLLQRYHCFIIKLMSNSSKSVAIYLSIWFRLEPADL